MKKYFIVIILILGLGVLSWAQGSKDLFDAKKSEAELEIMKGILSTTISYTAKTYQKDPWRINLSNINAYYLVGQGAAFVIPTSALRPINLAIDFSRELPTADQLARLREQNRLVELKAVALSGRATESIIGTAVGSGVGSGIGSGIGPGLAAPPAPPKPPAPPAPSVPPQVDREELRKQVEEYQLAIKRSREESSAIQERFLESLKEIRVYLIEALANYGDSLTTVKPGEYINLF